MKEYLVPTGDGEAQFIERRSRFIGHIFLTETEEEALARLKQMREPVLGCDPQCLCLHHPRWRNALFR